MVMHLGAENANDPPQNGVDPMNIPNPAVTAVTCEAAAKQFNALNSPLLHFESSVSDRVDFISSAKHNSNSKGKNPCTMQQKQFSSSNDAAAQHRTYASVVSSSKGNRISVPNSAFPCLNRVDTSTALQRSNNLIGGNPNSIVKEGSKQELHLPSMYAVTFHTVSTSSEHLQSLSAFMCSLLQHLQWVDTSTTILPRPDMATTKVLCSIGADIPANNSDSFWESYVKLSPSRDKTHLNGTFWMSSHSRFAVYKAHSRFLQWMNGPQKVFLGVPKTGPTHVGLLLHVLPRADLTNFIIHRLRLKLSSGAPQFRLEVKTLYRKNRQTQAYAVMVDSESHAAALAASLSSAFPPSLEMFFMPNEAWNFLSAQKKAVYFVSHSVFRSDRRNLLFKGILDSEAILSKPNVSVRDFLKQVSSKNGDPLFVEVSNSIEGCMVLDVRTAYYPEARQWLSQGLIQVAQQATPSSLPKLFVRPQWVERTLVQFEASPVASQLDVYQEFQGRESPSGADDSTIILSTTPSLDESSGTSEASTGSSPEQASTTFETPVTSRSIQLLAVQVTSLHKMATQLASDFHDLVAPSTSPDSHIQLDTTAVHFHDIAESRAGSPCLSVQSPDSSHLSHSTSTPSCRGKVAWKRAREFAATRKRALDAITSVTDS
jgi:hypothetical protein